LVCIGNIPTSSYVVNRKLHNFFLARQIAVLARLRFTGSPVSGVGDERFASPPARASYVCQSLQSEAFFFVGSVKSTQAILEIRVAVDNVVPVHWQKSKRNKPVIRRMLARDG
jgi:hypothetical protein